MGLLNWVRSILGVTDEPYVPANNRDAYAETQRIATLDDPVGLKESLWNETSFSVPLAAGTKRIKQLDPRPNEEIWQQLRQEVFRRDGWRCQVTGCINALDHLECHHITPVASGGHHSLDNLVALCLFHHACQPDHDIRSMKERVEAKRFWIRPSYIRQGSRVRWHFGRMALATSQDLKQFRTLYKPICPCGNADWHGYLRTHLEELVVLCPACENGWRIPLGLHEEACIALASCLVPTANIGRLDAGSFDPEIDCLRIHPVRVKVCPYCFIEDRPRKCGYLRPQKGSNGDFLGCVNYSEPRLRCRYTEPFR